MGPYRTPGEVTGEEHDERVVVEDIVVTEDTLACGLTALRLLIRTVGFVSNLLMLDMLVDLAVTHPEGRTLCLTLGVVVAISAVIMGRSLGDGRS